MRDSRGRYKRKSEIEVYQDELCNKLKNIFFSEQVQVEWPSMQAEYDLTLYSPRIDVAVGPFATQERYGHIYNEMVNRERVQNFIRRPVRDNRRNLEDYGDFVRANSYDEIIHKNYNARCFMAIEIENFVSRKHLMGGAVNASALGRLGVVIPWSSEKLRAFVKLVRYLHYLRYAEKNTFDTSNLLIITRDQMDRAIEEALNNTLLEGIH